MTQQHKQVAQQLRIVLAEQGIDIQHAHALHIIAAAYGLPNWNTLAARPETSVLEPEKAMLGVYERFAGYSDKEPNLSMRFSKGRLTAITSHDSDEPSIGSEEWIQQLNKQGIPVFAPAVDDEMAANPDGHFLEIASTEHIGKNGRDTTQPAPQLFKRVTTPQPEPSAKALAQELLALLKKEAVEVTEQEAYDWATKLN